MTSLEQQPDAEGAAEGEQHELSFDCVTYLMRYHLDPLAVLSCSAVNREWRRAAQEQFIWLAFIRREYGDTLVRRACPPNARAFYAQLSCFNPGALTGWCEDMFTLRGRPYTMYLGEMNDHKMSILAAACGLTTPAPPPSLAHKRTIECKSLWTYTVPNPRTRMRMYALPIQPEVLDGARALPVATSKPSGAPLYSQRVKIIEYEKITGVVDVPNAYFTFRVGPVLLGCFLPPEYPLHVIGLRTPKQMMGLIVLWDAGLALSSLNAPAPLTGEALCTQAGLQAGEVYTGTVLTNWHQHDSSTGQKLGHALLGRIKVTCLSVQPASKDPEELPKWLTTRDSDIVSSSSDSGESDDSSTPKKPLLPALQARFLVEVAEREWLISPQGLPVRYEIEAEPSYTPAVTAEANVYVFPDGTIKPASPSDATAGQLPSDSTSSATPSADVNGFDFTGIASGGVLTGMLIHKQRVAHRCVFGALGGSLRG